MFPLFETLAVEKGNIQNIEYHQARYEQSLRQFYGKSAVKIFNLLS
ncbi:aminotransferase, class IV family protein [Rodentibacter pneumotropicus]|uniref:Aminotransferase, class IV family protein n=1 Tax=Rodentibacter pneumotropicus TaxID=758 RepID=A0A448MMQ7_9PAST|nr:aminotransferase, class IV family protein [Rodentibacter pneumotropicus]